MELILSVIKADVGSTDGRIRPSRAMRDRAAVQGSLPIVACVGSSGGDIALLLTRRQGLGNSDVHSDGAPVVGCAASCVQDGELTEPREVLAHPFRNRVRNRVADEAVGLRRRGF